MEHLQEIILTFGYIGIFLVIFAESGFLLGFFLPGDSLLFTLGLLASQEYFDIGVLIPLCVVGAILGDNFGYYCGKKFGPKIFNREDSLFFHRKYVDKAEAFYARYGKKTIILARFVPIVRTFAPILAGVGKMDYKTFFTYNIIGGVVWPAGLLSLGYFLGSLFPETEKYLTLIILGIIFVSFIPVILEFFKKKEV